MRNETNVVYFLLIMMQRPGTSSTAAIRKSLERRLGVLEAQDFEWQPTEEELRNGNRRNMEEGLKAIFRCKEKVSEISEIIAFKTEFQYLDVKVEPLMDIIDNSCKDKNRKSLYLLVWLHNMSKQSLETREYYSLLNGSLSIEKKHSYRGV